MKVLIVSDTHGRNGNFLHAYEKVKPVDLVLHAGDTEGYEDELEEMVDCPFVAVAGNNDFYTYLPREQEVQVGKYKVLLSHGHYYRISMTRSILAKEAAKRDCQIAIYGHTHCPRIDHEGGIVMVNPGSLSFPRQENRKPSYVVMDIDRFGEAHFHICYL